MITPKYLQKGDNVSIVAPAGKIARENVESAVRVLNSWGLNVKQGDNLFHDHFQYSATDVQRFGDLQNVLNDPAVKAIICARGGYGSIRIIDQLDFTVFRKNPKWLIGFSDITVFHAHINKNFRIETIHGPMAAGLAEAVSAESLRKALFGETLSYTFPGHMLSRKGKAGGELVGGNLAILCSLIGSESEPDTRRKILFIEDVGEYLYRLDRMMQQLKRAGKLDKLRGLIVGGITDMKDNGSPFGKSPYEIIAEAVQEYDYPVCFGFPAGHMDDNRALILGRKVNLNVDDFSTLNFEPALPAATVWTQND
jgi:muramoyltetrapeptide carboxypeptidase